VGPFRVIKAIRIHPVFSRRTLNCGLAIAYLPGTLERDTRKWKPVCARSRSELSKVRMILSPNRSSKSRPRAARPRFAIAALLLGCLMPEGAANAQAMPAPADLASAPADMAASSGAVRLAQAQPVPTPAAPPPAAQAPGEPVGNVATLTGSATVTRNNTPTPLNLKDDIYPNDVLQTSANSTLGVTFSDATTFSLTANAQITVDSYLYEDGGKQNGALFDITQGTVAFVASAVAKTGDMKISTPTTTLGIRGTTGLVEVPPGDGTAGANNIKLYPDPDGTVGHIDVSDRRSGARLGSLTQGTSGFTVRPGAGGRMIATSLVISPQQALRDQGIVRQVHAAQAVGRQIVTERRIQRQQNRANPRGPQRQNSLPRAPGVQRQPGAPGVATPGTRKPPPPPKRAPPPKQKKR
jgi:hypothetical protein